MDVKAKLVEKVSEKTGNKYVCIEVYLTPTYKKILLVNNAEVELIRLANTKN